MKKIIVFGLLLVIACGGNRLDLARTALLLGNYSEADHALRGVKESDRNRADFHELAALLEVAVNNIPAAEAEAAAAAKLEPRNKSLQLNLAELDVHFGNKKLVDAAKKSLEDLSADPAYRRDALRQLAVAALRDGDFAHAEALSQKLQLEKPLALEDQLLNLTILKKGMSTNFDQALVSLEKQVGDNPQQVNALSGWLVGQSMTAEALQWLLGLPAKMRQEQAVVVALSDCYAARQNWPDITSLLADLKWGDSDFLRLALLSRALREQKDDLAAQANWQKAVTLASGRRQPLCALLRLANAWGWDKEKEAVAWTVVERYPSEHWALQLLDRFYTANDNTRGLQKVYATLMKNDASDVMAKNNFAAVSLLLGLRLPEAHVIAKEIYDRFPQDAIIVSTYAYSLHVQGRTQEGLQLLAKLPEDKLHLPAVATYYGVLLAAAGQPDKAKPYLDIARASKLLPEEKALVTAAQPASPSPK